MGAKDYASKDGVVTFDSTRCIHARECVRGLPAVFDPKARPWIAPANAGADELAAVIRRCPTGALSFRLPDGTAPEEPDARNTAALQPDGPTYLRGRLVFNGDAATPVEHFRVAICRCGASANKPFCDGRHKDVGFRDAGLCNNRPAQTPDAPTGPVKLHPKPNGPLVVEGRIEFVTADGTRFVSEPKTWLCRCGGSANKPFCDGTHKRIGFTG